MELKKGMYIRYLGNIAKVFGVAIDKNNSNLNRAYTEVETVFFSEIDKASFNIIDLIKVGDYVNGYKVLFIDVFFSGGKNVKCINNEEERVCFYEEDIKDIITKEQFNSCKYVVERDK